MSLLGLQWRNQHVEYYPRGEHRTEWFLELNPRGELPVLVEDETVVEDAQAVLLYLARHHDGKGSWYPQHDAVLIGQISTWLAFADALTQTASAARLHDGLLQHHIDAASARSGAHELLRVLDEHLWFAEHVGQQWLCPGTHPTIADVACFPDVMLAEEGRISLRAYPAIRRWTDRIKQIPGFITMPGIFPP